MSSDRWVLAYWIDEQRCSAVREEFVLNKEMLKDPYLEDYVYEGLLERNPPPGGWKKHLARILNVSGTKEAIRKSAAFYCNHFRCPLVESDSSNTVIENRGQETSEPYELDLAKRSSIHFFHQESSQSSVSSSHASSAVPPEELLHQVLRNQKKIEDRLVEMEKSFLSSLHALAEGMKVVQSRLENAANGVKRMHTPLEAEDPVKKAALAEAEDLLAPFIPGGKSYLMVLVQLGKSPTDALNNIIKVVFSREELLASSVTGKRSKHKKLDPEKFDAVSRYACLKLGINADELKNQLRSKIRGLRYSKSAGDGSKNAERPSTSTADDKVLPVATSPHPPVPDMGKDLTSGHQHDLAFPGLPGMHFLAEISNGKDKRSKDAYAGSKRQRKS